MTPHQRIRHWRKYAQRQTAIEEMFMPRFERAINKQFDTFVSVVKSDGIENAKNHINRIVTPQSLQEATKRLYTFSGLSEASYTYSLLKERHLKLRGFGFNQQWTSIIQQYLGNVELLNTVQGITDTTKERILKVIADGIEAGESVDQIVSKLQSDEYTTARARRIVRTESVAATSLGSMVGAMSTGIMYQKEWISGLDHRTRRRPRDQFDHLVLNGTVVDMEQSYNNGESIRYPGDKKASAGNIVNCRCTQGFIPKRDSNGRIMRYDSTPLRPGERPIQPGNEMSTVLLQTIVATILGNAVQSFIPELIGN